MVIPGTPQHWREQERRGGININLKVTKQAWMSQIKGTKTKKTKTLARILICRRQGLFNL